MTQFFFSVNYIKTCRVFYSKERNREESREAARCKELLSARISEFVEEIIFSHFEGLVRFVKDCEVMLTRGNNEALRNEERRIFKSFKSIRFYLVILVSYL